MTDDSPPRFQDAARAKLRTRRPWSRLAYISGALPRAIAGLAPDLCIGPGGRVLDYGAADSPYRHLFPRDADIVPADLRGNHEARLELNANGTVPVSDGSFDAVLSTQVLEHVADPSVYLAECHRVLRPGGRLLLSTHGFMVYHPDPVDYWRWTCAGLDRAVTEAGFEVRRFEGVMGLGATGVQFVQDALYWKLVRPLRAPFALACQSLIALLDWLQGPKSKRMNALVYVLIAEKP